MFGWEGVRPIGSRPGWRDAFFQSGSSFRRSSSLAKAKLPNGKVERKPDFWVFHSS